MKSTPSTPSLQSTSECSEAAGEMKDALQNELRNTLSRKVKVQDVERGDCTKQLEIEKTMQNNRTEVKLKLNTNPPKLSPTPARKNIVDDKPALSSPVLLKTLSRYGPSIDEKADMSTKKLDLVNTTDLQRPPAKPQRAMHFNNTKKDDLLKKELKEPLKVEISTFENSRAALYGTLRKVKPLGPLKIDVNVNRSGSVRNEILSPEVKSGYAAIRPSRIKTLTRQGSYVSHIDIVDGPKTVTKSPVLLVEPSQSAQLSPQSSNSIPSKSNQSSPIPPTTRTVILDSKFGKTAPIKSPNIESNTHSKKLLISHPKASFTLGRYTSRQAKSSDSPYSSPVTKPVFRILTDLEQAEQREAEREQLGAAQNGQPCDGSADKSYVSFAKELANAPNNYPDTAVKTSTVGVTKKGLFFENINMRDIKIDIVENGQLKVVNK
ncbi:uncharacterized protein LOC129771243 [Toxorhynchites rutilus septentrionalis]|nr:uncharacterized protein LOC129771243 [Toxorhynchites rutilus septentrionalis]